MVASTTKILLLAAAIQVRGHARIDDPTPRGASAHYKYCCYPKLSIDPTGPIENAVQYADADYNCNAYLCRGYQYGDNKDNVIDVKAGDTLHFHINLVASHKPGYANMSVVDTAANTVITALKTWDHWPDVTDGSTFEEKTQFNITVPEGLESRCDQGGKCVMQWFWYAISNVQTYESCHDFYIVS
ncbi:hypothetical protein GQ53DRAFT_637985 [Thozetella sp. PMI_491]|nr:hypothetical protein GQ53DRAFT_637985 [Thozetella sp. PMI_491]